MMVNAWALRTQVEVEFVSSVDEWKLIIPTFGDGVHPYSTITDFVPYMQVFSRDPDHPSPFKMGHHGPELMTDRLEHRSQPQGNL